MGYVVNRHHCLQLLADRLVGGISFTPSVLLANSGYSIWEIKRKHTDKILDQKIRDQCCDKISNWLRNNKKHIIHYSFNERDWDFANKILKFTDIQAPDALHLTAAIKSGCQIIATSDKNFIKGIKAFKEINEIIIPIDCKKDKNSRTFKNNFDQITEDISNSHTFILLNAYYEPKD